MKYFQRHPFLMVVIGVLGVSLSSILVRYSTAPSAVTAAYRMIFTVLLLSPMVLTKKEHRKELKQVSRSTVLLSSLSGLCLATHFALWFESLQHTTVASSTTIVCTDAIWVALGFCLFLKGKLSAKAVAFIAVAFAGSVLIACADSAIGGTNLYGDALALAAAVAAACYTLIGSVVRTSTSTSVYTFIVYPVCAVVLTGLCVAQGHNLLGYGIRTVVVGFLLAVFSTLLGHSVFSWCLKYFSPAFVTSAKLCEPVGAAILAAILFGELPAPLQIFGSILILIGVFCYSRLEHASKKG